MTTHPKTTDASLSRNAVRTKPSSLLFRLARVFQRLTKNNKLNSIRRPIRVNVICIAAIVIATQSAAAAQPHTGSTKLFINWKHTVLVSKSTPTFQVVVNPMLRRTSPISKMAFEAIKNMGADYVRYVPWLPYPKLAVAELKPPNKSHTYWNFSYIDPMMRRFMQAMAGHSTVINFSTIPEWMFKTKKPVPYPKNPNTVDWHYEQGTRLLDPSCRQLANYYARLVSWFTRGGFRDQHGKWHESGYHYKFPYWEVLNEVDFEHHMTPEQYTRRYDAIVSAIHKVSPKTKFIGLALALPEQDGVKYFEYFLNHKNHRAGIPLNFISFHFYASPAMSEGPTNWQYTFFDQAKGFLATTRYIIAIRNQLSPQTKIDTDELGVILPTDSWGISKRKALHYRIPKIYWNAAASLYAYLFLHLSRLGINVIGESQLVGYPSQFPSVTMINWKNGKPNARYWVLKMIIDNFHPGDRLVWTTASARSIAAQAFITTDARKLLLINKRYRSVEVSLPKTFNVSKGWIVDEATGDEPAQEITPVGNQLLLPPFAVAVIVSH